MYRWPCIIFALFFNICCYRFAPITFDCHCWSSIAVVMHLLHWRYAVWMPCVFNSLTWRFHGGLSACFLCAKIYFCFERSVSSLLIYILFVWFYFLQFFLFLFHRCAYIVTDAHGIYFACFSSRHSVNFHMVSVKSINFSLLLCVWFARTVIVYIGCISPHSLFCVDHFDPHYVLHFFCTQFSHAKVDHIVADCNLCFQLIFVMGTSHQYMIIQRLQSLFCFLIVVAVPAGHPETVNREQRCIFGVFPFLSAPWWLILCCTLQKNIQSSLTSVNRLVLYKELTELYWFP